MRSEFTVAAPQAALSVGQRKASLEDFVALQTLSLDPFPMA